MPKTPFVISKVGRPYPDNWPWGTPHRHPFDDFLPFEGFNVEVPEEGTAVSNIARSVREAKIAFGSLVSVPALFACDVEDGDIVIPLPCKCDDDEACNELMETLAKIGKLPDAIWIPAFRETTDSSISTLSAVDVTTYDPPFFGVAYRKIERVMVGPIVVHPRFQFHTGDKVYADKNGNLTTTTNENMVGVCLAPGSVYLLQYASSLKAAMEDLYSNAVKDTIDKIEDEGLDGDKIGVTTDGTTLERPLEIRFGDVVNVKDFGAKGDGKTNDTNAFNLAIARAQQLGSNVCLFIPVGTYLVTTLPNVPCYGPGSIKYNSYTYSPFELLFKLNGAIQKDTNGRYKVDFTKMSEADLAALIKQLLPSTGGGLTTDEDGKLVVDFTQMSEEELREMIESLLPDTGGGLTTDEDGKLVLDFSQLTPTQKEDLISQIVQEGGGLSVDENGQIYVDFDSMPTDKFEAMLKSIRVPIWLDAHKNFYVNQSTGSDTLDAGRGESESKPFKTIQAAVNYIADNYNLSNYNATVSVAANYNSTSTSEIVLKSYSTVGGSIIISGPDQDDLSKTVIGRVRLDKSCIYMLRNLTVKVGSGSSYIAGVWVQAGRLDLQNVLVDMSDSVVSNGSLYAIAAESSGLVRIYSTNSLEVKSGCTIKVGPAMMGTTKALLSANSGGNIQFSADILVDGSADLTYSVTAMNLGIIRRTLSTFINPGRLPTFTANGTITGSRYRASANGIIATSSGGPEFFPGSTEGVTSAGGQYT